MAVGSTTQMPIKIESALRKAAAVTGVDFQYLVDTAKRESGFRASVKAPTSSASGLFQFIESTWLQMVKEKGPELGLKDVAAQITKTSTGKYQVENKEQRKEILELRNKPEIAALMAGAFTKLNADAIENKIGRKPTAGELYIAHFLGAHNGGKLIHASNVKPEMKAADLFPQAAKSNRSLFYKGRNPVSVKGLYQNLVRRHSVQQIDVAQSKAEAKITELASVEKPIILQGSADYKKTKEAVAISELDQAGQNGQIFHHDLEGGLFTNQKMALSNNSIETKPDVKFTSTNSSKSTQMTQGQIGVWASLNPAFAEGKHGEKAYAPKSEPFAAQTAKQKPILDLSEGTKTKAGQLFRKGGLG